MYIPVYLDDLDIKYILDGKKTQIWLPVKDQEMASGRTVSDLLINCPYGYPGDILWVKEFWCAFFEVERKYHSESRPRDVVLDYKQVTPYERTKRNLFTVYYGAGEGANPDFDDMWVDPYDMPIWAHRIDLIVRSVNVKQVMLASRSDLLASGIEGADGFPSKYHETKSHLVSVFKHLWNARHSDYPWDTNPYAWVIDFIVGKVKKW